MITVITSFNMKAWDLYAKKMVTSFIEYWDKNIKLIVYYDGPEIPHKDLKNNRIEFRSLNDNQDIKTFRETYKDKNGQTKEGYNYRLDALKFSWKVFALADYFFECTDLETPPDWILWLDSDTITLNPLSEETLRDMLGEKKDKDPPDVVHLGRTAIDYSETGFLALSLQYTKSTEFVLDWKGLYTSGELFGYREWTDAFVFTRLLHLHEAHGLTSHNLSPNCKDLNAFSSSPLREYLKHFKGPTKMAAGGPTVDRFGVLSQMIKQYSFSNLLEIGTWDGSRAIQLAEAAFENNNVVHYTGFDLFDEVLNKEEDVKKVLTSFAEKKQKENNKKIFTFCLIRGDSKETLKVLKNKDYCKIHNINPQFAFISGNNTIEHIQSDYKYLKNISFIAFDNIYGADADDKRPDIQTLGANVAFDNISDKKFRKGIVPSSDPIIGGGIVGIGFVIHDKRLADPPEASNKVPVKVVPKDCMPDEYIQNNVVENKKRIKKWILEKATAHGDQLVVISGGPTVYGFVDKIKELYKQENTKVICVKHSLPFLLKNGIIPWACIILDPRPIDGISTHGVIRKTLFKRIPKKTKFLVASMTDLSVVKLLKKKKANIIGWHAYSDAIRNFHELKDTMLVTGGTCSAMRAVGLGYTLGFRTVHLFGMDGCLDKEPENAKELDKMSGHQKYMQVAVGDDDKKGSDEKFWTTGELLAMAQDFEQMVDRDDVDLTFQMYGDSLVSRIWESSGVNKQRKTYQEIING